MTPELLEFRGEAGASLHIGKTDAPGYAKNDPSRDAPTSTAEGGFELSEVGAPYR